MRILKIQTLRGPNYWSIRRHKLIVMRLDLETLAETPSNEIPGFYEGLVEALPSLEGHYCSPGCHGGFLMRVREGTMMGHIVEHVALELQELAGMHVGFGRTRETATPGIYQVVIEYLNEEAGRYAGRAAVRLCQSIVDRGRYPKAELEQDIQDLKDLWRDASLGPSTEAIVKEAEKRGIPWMQLSARFLIQLGYGVNHKRMQATMTDKTGILGVELACDKEATKRILAASGVPVPRGTVINFLDDLEEAIEYVGGYPIVIKPLDGNHGRGITIDIRSWEEAEAAYEAARQVSRSIIVERYYVGRDHRVLVVDGKVVAVAERVPAHVIGNGRSTIAELIEEINQDPNRGDGHDKVLTKIELDRTSYQLLERAGYTLNSVPPKGTICYLRATANLSTGGTAVDRTDEIHPENIWLAQRVVKIIGLDIAGLDIVTTDISRPLRELDGVIVEVNAAPGFRMHVAPSQGIPRNVAGAVMDMLFPNEQSGRIPILSVTGTNGKTTTTRLLAHIYKQTGKVVGYTTTDGTYIGDYLVESGDNTGPQSAHVILQDPTVEVAVLETARGGILRSGLGFESANVGVVLNVAADHLGIGDIDTIDQLANLKSVVAESVYPDGYAVLNADDRRVAAMAEKTKANIAYFTMNPDSELVRKHIQKGGVAAVYENGYLSIVKGDWTHRIERAEQIPLTMGGRAPFMIANALAASLAAFVQNVSIEQIRAGLRTFRASVSQTPGRMNLFNLGNYHALVDYAHNPASYEAVGAFVRNWTSGQRIGVVGGPGDRRDEDFVTLGKLAAEIFDYIIVKEDDDTRGRPRGSASALITKGITQVKPDARYESILDETQAINKGLDMAPANGLVVILPESVSRAIKLIKLRGLVKEEIQQQNPSTTVIDNQNGVASSSVINTLL
ncbi:Cyanophycin synthetase [Trichormus variabilis ATCC 29413]|uniref:Cyanophycin synthetase n=2 Tax=Anabaena variabilis TaxID=264691 RepID=CPHA_TRIV2|nr:MULTISPECIES: cyanophycin synthetase [Nostocaceae]O86109.1 RecName: Full=Cyanophycin synthetase; AltName: Full=Cyanophycin synthase [Trichormus variabilis ATCC 29413]ABA21436.1 Cyanophycin synthetase [Trichormus variabilis ATCC 29413]MBC1216244.1 cyanophycin synthetase [Trichormus variabilis ARAD]MBC1254262.1 cyanophycin synthetase [Trichormus variabilis V5]MBC1268178.1 cyanophycin synthetase [Trichormus variabilis FSR]MBC1301104.1 cyanophycin synthetase [Trichormus variabilis N2B]